MRFPIRIAAPFRPLLALLGATRSRAFVELEGERLRVRFGSTKLDLPVSAIVSAQRAKWPWWGGIGWRLGLGGSVGLIGSTEGVVRLETADRLSVLLVLLPVACTRLFLSLEDPDGFLSALDRARSHGPP